MEQNKKALTTVLLLAFCVSLPFLNLVVMVQADHHGHQSVRRVWVNIGNVPGQRSVDYLINRYRGAYYNARGYWYNKGVPGDIWADGGDTAMYFNTIYDFNNYWDSVGGGYCFLIDAEQHYEYWGGGYAIVYGNGKGSIFSGSFSMLVFLKTYNPTLGVYNISSDWLTQVIKRGLGNSFGMGSCWLGYVLGGFLECLMESGSFNPRTCRDLCWSCNNAFNGIKSAHGW